MWSGSVLIDDSLTEMLVDLLLFDAPNSKGVPSTTGRGNQRKHLSNGLRRSVSTMDDAPSVGCRGTSTTGTASTVTRQSDSEKADFSTSDTGVDDRWVCLTCTCLLSGSLLLG